MAAEPRDELRGEITGQAATGPPEQGKEELVGLTAAAIVLFLVFGSLTAMSLPLVTAVMSIAVSLAGVGLLANVIRLRRSPRRSRSCSGWASASTTRCSSSPATDRGCWRAGQPGVFFRVPATVTAVDTSGRAVLFAGITVCIALLGLSPWACRSCTALPSRPRSPWPPRSSRR